MCKINKKAGLIISIIFLILSGGVFLYRQEIEDYLESKEMESVFAISKDYVVYENSKGKLIENKKDGLIIRIPENWLSMVGTDIFGLSSERSVVIYSSNYSLAPRKGCIIEIEITRAKENKEGFLERGTDKVREDLINLKETPVNKENYQYYEVISVREREALKEVVGNIVTIEIPTENRVYSFQTISIPEECLEKLNEVLQTASLQ